MDLNKLAVPESEAGDVAHVAITTALSAIPFLGAGELFKFIVTPSIEKRREQWMQHVVEAINELQTSKGINIEDLKNSEEFTTLLLQTTQAAFKTHLTSKHVMLRTALINATVSDIDFDTKQFYLSLVDKLTPSHIYVLLLVEKYKEYTIKIRSAHSFYEKLLESDELKSISKDDMSFFVFLEELKQSGLIVTSSLFVIIDADVEQIQFTLTNTGNTSGLPQIAISDLARRFLNFIGSEELI